MSHLRGAVNLSTLSPTTPVDTRRTGNEKIFRSHFCAAFTPVGKGYSSHWETRRRAQIFSLVRWCRPVLDRHLAARPEPAEIESTNRWATRRPKAFPITRKTFRRQRSHAERDRFVIPAFSCCLHLLGLYRLVFFLFIFLCLWFYMQSTNLPFFL